ncbi:MAG: hypothetical protein AB1797_00385 [bacterium]
MFSRKRKKTTGLWLLILLLTLSCAREEMPPPSSASGDSTIETGREEDVARKEGWQGERSSRAVSAMKEEMEELAQEAEKLGQRDISPYRKEAGFRRLRERLEDILRGPGSSFSEQEKDRLMRKYVEIPFKIGEIAKRRKERFEKRLEEISQEASELRQRYPDRGMTETEEEEFKQKLADVIEERDDRVNPEEVSRLFEDYVGRYW